MSGIFISYRRSDSAGHTGRLADDLGEKLVGQALFRDIEAIEAGEDFVEALARAVGDCSVMLVVIGPTWARVTTHDGQRRLHQPGDFVRMEIEAALARNVRVIPVLVGDAQMPNAEDLPESMAPLLRRNAYAISDRRWQYDIDQLLDILEKIPGVTGRKRSALPPTPPPPMQSASLPPPTAPATALPTWAKIVFGLVGLFIVLGVIGMFMDDPEAVAPAATSPPTTVAASVTPSAPTASPAAPADSVAAEVDGLWQTEDGLYYQFVYDGRILFVLSGETVDPANAANSAPADASPKHAGAELAGEAQLDGRKLEVTLTDTFSGDSELLQVTLAADGRTLQGQLQGTPVTLQRR